MCVHTHMYAMNLVYAYVPTYESTPAAASLIPSLIRNVMSLLFSLSILPPIATILDIFVVVQNGFEAVHEFVDSLSLLGGALRYVREVEALSDA